jgi:hypothetical protein
MANQLAAANNLATDSDRHDIQCDSGVHVPGSTETSGASTKRRYPGNSHHAQQNTAPSLLNTLKNSGAPFEHTHTHTQH